MKRNELKRTCSLKNKGTRLKQNVPLGSNPSKTKEFLAPKTSLKAKSALAAKTPLKSKGVSLKQTASLKSNTQLSSSTPLTSQAQLKVKQKTAKKLKGEYFSIFGSLDVCAITGEQKAKIGKGKWSVVPHHIFSGPYKAKSEEYGFILPLRVDWHTGHSYSIHEDSSLDKKYKVLCQEYYMNTLGKTEEEFIKEFGKSYTHG